MTVRAWHDAAFPSDPLIIAQPFHYLTGVPEGDPVSVIPLGLRGGLVSLGSWRSAASRAIVGAQREFACCARVLNVVTQPGTDPKFQLCWQRILAMRQARSWFPDRKPEIEGLLRSRVDFS